MVLEVTRALEALRRHRRRRRPHVHAAPGRHRRPRRAQRRRQDDGVQPAHRLHPPRSRVGAPARPASCVGLGPDKIARRGMVRSFQDVRLFQRLTLPPERRPRRAGPARRAGHTAAGRGRGRSAASERATMEKAEEWLRFVGMHDFADVPAGALSYGQSKLVSLARVLASEAEVILLDEPASRASTPCGSTRCSAWSSRCAARGRTICIVEHNLHVVGRLADHVYFMELGRITAEGTIDELTGSERLAEAYFGTVTTCQLARRPTSEHRCCASRTSAPATAASRSCSTSSLHVGAGEVVTLLGHNGSGKTHHDQDRPRPVPGAGRHGSSTAAATSPGPASARTSRPAWR